MRKNRKSIKAKWEWVNTPDVKERLQAAFDIIFSHIEEDRPSDFSMLYEPESESQGGQRQLPLF